MIVVGNHLEDINVVGQLITVSTDRSIFPAEWAGQGHPHAHRLNSKYTQSKIKIKML